MKPLRVFVIQPYKEKHSDAFWQLILRVCNTCKDDFLAFRADTEPSNGGSRLQDRIEYYLKKADICIADFTVPNGGTRNENVLIEVGASYTLNIPVILVSNTGLPADIKGNFYVEFDPEKIDDENEVNKFLEQVYDRLSEAFYQKLTDNFRSNQFIAYGYSNRREVDFYSFFQRSQERIYILTTNLGFIVDEKLFCGINGEKRKTFLELFNESKIGKAQSSEQRKTILDMINEVTLNKPSSFQIRILALDPDSNYANERASALNRDKQAFREKMRTDLLRTKEIIESNTCPASIVVKTYDAYPLQMTYFFDNYVISSVVAFGRSSRDCTTYVHSLMDRGAKETFETHFENLWGNSKLYATNNRGSELQKQHEKNKIQNNNDVSDSEVSNMEVNDMEVSH
jgi:hypothetical protein